MASAPPEGFERIDGPVGWAWVRPEVRTWCEGAFAAGETLFEAARGGPLGGQRSHAGGRGAVRLVGDEAPQSDWVVRHARRGGWMAPLLGDCYPAIGAPRVESETWSAQTLAEAGIRTPRVLAAATYPSHGVRRHDLVTLRIAGRTLAEALGASGGLPGLGQDPQAELSRGLSDTARDLLAATGATIDAMAAASLWHVDLNAHNLLVGGADVGGEPPIWVLDLDRMRRARPARARRAMWARLLRSLTKLGVDPAMLAIANEEAEGA